MINKKKPIVRLFDHFQGEKGVKGDPGPMGLPVSNILTAEVVKF